MLNTIRRYLNGSSMSETSKFALIHAYDPVANISASACLTSAGLTTNAALAKTGGSTTYAVVNRVLLSISSATNMAALVGSVPNAQYGTFHFYTDQNGTLTTLAGSPATTLAGVLLPATPMNTACIGIVIINPTGTGPFVGGTTSLTDGTVVPNAVFVNFVGNVDPSISVRG